MGIAPRSYPLRKGAFLANGERVALDALGNACSADDEHALKFVGLAAGGVGAGAKRVLVVAEPEHAAWTKQLRNLAELATVERHHGVHMRHPRRARS